MSGLDLGGVQGFGQLPIRPRLLGEAAGQGDGAGAPPATGFGGALSQALMQVSDLRADVDQKWSGLATGENVPLHELMTSMGKSEVAFNLMLEVRNKLVDAWDKISRSVV